jgi:hypothetical protein
VEQPIKIALWNLREMFLPGACNQNSHALLFASGITMIGIPQLMNCLAKVKRTLK